MDNNKSGNLKRPSYVEVAQWCLNAWKKLSDEQIKKSFIQCGLGLKRDDTQLHSKLLDILTTGQIPEFTEEKTGLTDDEEDNEEEQETIDYDI